MVARKRVFMKQKSLLECFLFDWYELGTPQTWDLLYLLFLLHLINVFFYFCILTRVFFIPSIRIFDYGDNGNPWLVWIIGSPLHYLSKGK
jgi:hypothetical protein